MMLSPTQQNEVITLAVTLFGAAPGGYKAYLNGVYSQNDHNMGATALALGNEPVFAAMYSGTPAQNIDKILNNLSVNAISDAALKAIAVNYITDQVNSGANIAQLYAFSLDYMDNNSGFEEVQAIINEKVAVANVFTNGAGKAEVDLEALIAHIADVMPSETGEPNNLTMMGAVIHSDGPAPSADRAEWGVNFEAQTDTGTNDLAMTADTAAVIATAITAATTADNAAKATVIAADTALESQALADAQATVATATTARDAAIEATTAMIAALEAAVADATVTAITVNALTNAVSLAQEAHAAAILAATYAAAAVDNPEFLAFILAQVRAKDTAADTAATLDSTANLIPVSVMNEALINPLLYKATLTVTFSEGGSSAEPLVNGFESSVVIPTVNYLAFKSEINQAIKTAINEDAILSSLLTVQEGSSGSLIIQSWGVGVFAADNLALSITPATLTDLSTAEQAGLNLAWQSLNEGLTVSALTQSDLDTAAANVLAGSGDGVMALAFAGNGSTVEQNNIIEMRANDQVIVLSAQADSNEALVFDGAFGNDTIFNFNDNSASAVLASPSGQDTLDFTAHLNNVTSASGSVESQVDALTAQTSGLWSATQTLDANDFAIITGTVFTATDTWANLSSANFLAAIQNDVAVMTDYAGISDTTLDTSVEANTVGATSNSIVFVENSDNLGEYKVFALVADNTTTEFTAATLLGSIDFGGSIDATTVVIA